jgi:hypothetical protein
MRLSGIFDFVGGCLKGMRRLERHAETEQNQIHRAIVSRKSHGSAIAQITDHVYDGICRFSYVKEDSKILDVNTPAPVVFSIAGGDDFDIFHGPGCIAFASELWTKDDPKFVRDWHEGVITQG